MNSNNEQWVRKAFFERYNELLVQKAKDSTKVGKIALQSDKKDDRIGVNKCGN